MAGYVGRLEKDTLENSFFRKVVFTSNHSQLVLMSLKPLEEIGMEVHPDNDQFLRFESGEGKVVIDGEESIVKAGDAVVIPSGNQHNVINISDKNDLKLYTVYSPAHHPDGTIHKTKAEAVEAESKE
jgi:mannose-6-phosphate isomerase-like protein (cupin superfamily)